VIHLCEHILTTNFTVISREAQSVWLYAALRASRHGIVNIHINVLPRLCQLTDRQSVKVLDELSRHNFYDDDDDPFLVKWEDANLSVSKVLQWRCRWCEVVSREFIPASVREDVLSIGFCVHCESPDNLEGDHIRPVSLGGSSDRENLQPICVTCNRKKKNRFIG